MTQNMVNGNPPEHTRPRRLVAAAFTRRRVDELVPRIQQITDELLDVLTGTTEADLIASFASPLPIIVICELLGVPAQRRLEFRGWSATLVTGTMADRSEFTAAATAMVSYLRELIAAKRADPGDDLLSMLVTVREGADRLSADELTSTAFLLLVAGHEYHGEPDRQRGARPAHPLPPATAGGAHRPADLASRLDHERTDRTARRTGLIS